MEDWRFFRETALSRSLTVDGRLVATREVPEPLPPGPWAACLEHERLPFISYPYEWCFDMLRDAALFQLELVDRALAEGMELRDASPYNVQWRGVQPVFIDVPSFGRRREEGPWAGYRQFCRLYLFPLILEARGRESLQPLLRARLDGPSAAETAALLPRRDFWRPGVLLDVFLQASFEKKHARDAVRARDEVASAGFHPDLIRRNVRRLSGVVESLRWRLPGSDWSAYGAERPYSDDDLARKKAFVEAACAARPRRTVWDLGCNDGEFSLLAARYASLVLAMDSDAWVVNGLYRRLKAEGGTRILPLVMNMADPSPAQGWRGAERANLDSRSRPDLALALALVHHLSITAQVPLAEIVAWFRSLGAELVVEFVGREDPMAQRLLRNADARAGYHRDVFERELGLAFEVKETLDLAGGNRRLYRAVPKNL